MKLIRSSIFSLVGLLVLAPTPSSAQIVQARPSLDYFVDHQQLEVQPGTRERLGGIGGRIMWPLAPLALRWDNPLLERTSVGGYLVHARPEDDRDSRWQYGVQADFAVGPRLVGRVDPFVSVGLGTMEAQQPGRRFISMPYLIIDHDPVRQQQWLPRVPVLEVALPPERERLLTAKPGLGAKIYLGPGVDLRADVYRPIDLRDGTQRGLEVSGGISLRA